MKNGFKIAIVVSAMIGCSPLANAYNQVPLTPAWFVNVYQNIAENRGQVWRGQVLEVANPTQLIILNQMGHKVTVDLLHLTLKRDADTEQQAVSIQALQELVGKQIYILGSSNKMKLAAKLIDATGSDINLALVESGSFDINTTSLIFKYEKQQYINALNIAKSARIGIWKK